MLTPGETICPLSVADVASTGDAGKLATIGLVTTIAVTPTFVKVAVFSAELLCAVTSSPAITVLFIATDWLLTCTQLLPLVL